MGKTAKVVVCGMRGVGKTSVLEQLIYGGVSQSTEIHPTIEDIYVAHVETERGTREKVRFYDTAGLDPNNPELPRHYLVLADGYVLVYDTDCPESFNFVITLKKDIDKNRDKKEVTIIVLGNKMYAREENKVDNTQVANWAARERVKQYEVNAMDRMTLYKPFVYLATKLNPAPNKSSFPQLSMVRKAKDAG